MVYLYPTFCQLIWLNFIKGQLISKFLLGVFNFFQKTNENKSTWGIIVSSKVEFIRLFFGRNVGLKKSFRLCLTFNSYCILLFLSVSKAHHIKLNNRYWFSPRMISKFSDHCAQARRKQEDNLATVFLGIVLVFLICHTPRNICNLAETFYIDNSIECQQIKQNGFPFWLMVLNTIRFVHFICLYWALLQLQTGFLFQIFIFDFRITQIYWPSEFPEGLKFGLQN